MTSVVNQTGGIEIGGTVLYGMDAEHALKQAAKYDYGRERDIVKWIEAVLGEKLPSKDLHESLKSGIILCKLLNKIKPGMIKKYNTRAIALMEIENIKLYLEGCWKLGVPSSCLFISSDLYKARGMNEVLNNLEALSKISARMKTYTGPVMEIHERERSGSSGISSGKKYAPPAKKWATIEMGKPKHINETLNVEDIDIRSENLKLKQALEREICERQYLEKEIEELKAGGGSTSKGMYWKNIQKLYHYFNFYTFLGSSSSTSSERELQTKIEQLQKTINELERELTETKKRTPSKSTVGKANELPIVKSQLDDEIRAHKLTKQEYCLKKLLKILWTNINNDYFRLQNERDKLRKLESELRQVKSGSNKPVSAPVSSSSNKSDAIITNLRDENEMLRLLVSQLRTDLDLAVQYSAPEKQVVGKKHGPNYFIIDEIDESASADVARVESTLEAIFSSSEVEFSEVVELNEFFKNENGRRKFTVMLENVMQGGVVALSDNSFELLLYLINTTLTEMDTSDCNDLITAKILMRASSIVKRESDKQHIQTYISSYSVYHDINFWEELFWGMYIMN